MGSRRRAPGWVGRDEELARLRRALDTSARGEPTVSVLVGEAGVGKSSLLRVALAGRDALVVAASGDETEAELDYGVVEQLVADAPVAVEGRDLRSGADPLEVGAALLRTLDELPTDRPVVIVVDDAHLADTPSLVALTFAARRLRADPVALLLACRPEGVDHLPAGLLRLADRADGRLVLGGLDVEAVGQLAEAALSRPVPGPAAERLRHHTGGNPLHVLALLDELGADVITGPSALPAPRSYAGLVLSKVASCSPDGERLLVALAVLGPEAALAAAATVGEVGDPLAAADEVAALGLAHLVDRPSGRVLAFPHALVRASVYDDLPAHRRAALHRAAAAVTSGEESLRHRLAATPGPDPALAAEAAAAAARHAQHGAHHAAASLLLGSASVAATPAARAEHVLGAAHHLLVAGQPLGPLADEVATSPEGAARSFVLGRMALSAGDDAEATSWLERAWAQAQEEPDGPGVEGAVAETLAVIAIGRLRQDEAITWATRALASSGATMTATVLSNAYGIDGSFAAAEREMDAILARPASPQAAVDARTGRGIARLWADDLDGARQDLERVSALGIEHGAFHTHVNARAFLADALLRSGQLVEAVDIAEATAALTDDADAVWLAPLPHSVAAFALAIRGDLEPARAHAATSTAMAEALDLAPGHLWSDNAWLRIAVAAGDPEEVVTVGDRMVAAGWGRLPEPIHHWRADYTEALIAVDRVDDADGVVRALEADAATHPDAATVADACRARGVLEAARGDADAAEAAFARGLALDAGPARPLQRARLEIAAGAARRRRGQRRAAATVLEAACARLAAAGARPLLARGERELAACGLRPAKRSAAARDRELTPQEGFVARLVAAGRTNREVAAELVISVKTVEHHLSRIYAKLGVRSRTQLAAVMLGGEPRADAVGG